MKIRLQIIVCVLCILSANANNLRAIIDTDVYGCIDSLVINFNPVATIDDGSCEYVYGCTNEWYIEYNSSAVLDDGTCETLLCPEGMQEYILTLYDTYGDGWNGGYLTIQGINYTMDTGSVEAFNVCVEIVDCIQVNYSEGLWTAENSWTLSDTTGELLIEAGNESGVYGDCWGADACQYNGDSYAFNTGVVYECSYCICEPNPIYWCPTGMEPWQYSMWNCEYEILPSECGNTELEPIFGCFNPLALNYCDTCNVDDGSCEYIVSVSQIQSHSNESLYEGLLVNTSGVIVAISDEGFFLQEQNVSQEDGLWRGIFVEGHTNIAVKGNKVSFKALVEEVDGMTILTNITDYSVIDVFAYYNYINVNNTVLNEAYEGCLIRYNNLNCIIGNDAFGEATFQNPLGDEIITNSFIYQYPFELNTEMTVQGVVIEEGGEYKLCPRNELDIIPLVSISELNQEVVVNVTDQTLYVKSNCNDQYNYELYSVIGEQIAIGLFKGELSLSLEHYSNTSYILRVNNSFYRVIKK